MRPGFAPRSLAPVRDAVAQCPSINIDGALSGVVSSAEALDTGESSVEFSTGFRCLTKNFGQRTVCPSVFTLGLRSVKGSDHFWSALQRITQTPL